MTIEQIILMAVVPVGALLMLAFVHVHARLNPPAKRAENLTKSRPKKQADASDYYPLLLWSPTLGKNPSNVGGEQFGDDCVYKGVVVAQSRDIELAMKRWMLPKHGRRSSPVGRFAKLP